MASGRSRGYSNEVHFDHYGRKAEIGIRSPRFRFWLKAEGRVRLIDVWSCSGNGHCCGGVRFRSD